jgi:hypothetical protein
MASCHVGHTGTHLIIEVKQYWARIVLGWVTTEMTSMPGAVRMNNTYGLNNSKDFPTPLKDYMT